MFVNLMATFSYILSNTTMNMRLIKAAVIDAKILENEVP